MGATVFEPYGDGGYLVGSFNGIYHLERGSGRAFDLLTGLPAGQVSSVRPGDTMVTGYFRTPEGEEFITAQFITAHEQGLLPVGDVKPRGRFAMPSEMAGGYRMPLWNFLFELHNGRMFKDLIGDWYIAFHPCHRHGHLRLVLPEASQEARRCQR